MKKPRGNEDGREAGLGTAGEEEQKEQPRQVRRGLQSAEERTKRTMLRELDSSPGLGTNQVSM